MNTESMHPCSDLMGVRVKQAIVGTWFWSAWMAVVLGGLWTNAVHGQGPLMIGQTLCQVDTVWYRGITCG